MSPTFQRDEPWVLVLGTADWNQKIATNQHFVTRELACGAKVTFVESLGLRRPRLTLRDLRRVASRILRRPGRDNQGRQLPPGVDTISPLVIPFHGRWVAPLNQVLLGRATRRWRAHAGPRKLVAYTPTTYRLEAEAEFALYHCVDLLGEFPGISRRVVERAEQQLATRGVTAAASSEAVASHLRDMGFTKVLSWPNVADVEVFGPAHEVQRDAPRAVFAGNLTANKIDFDLLATLVERGVELHLAGPVAEGGGGGSRLVDALKANGVQVHGVLTPADLSALFSRCTVGLIPYRLNTYTAGVSPLKVFEYLAAGLAVVSTRLAALDPQLPGVALAGSPEEFVDLTIDALSVLPPPGVLAARNATAHEHSWRVRGTEVRAVVLGDRWEREE